MGKSSGFFNDCRARPNDLPKVFTPPRNFVKSYRTVSCALLQASSSSACENHVVIPQVPKVTRVRDVSASRNVSSPDTPFLGETRPCPVAVKPTLLPESSLGGHGLVRVRRIAHHGIALLERAKFVLPVSYSYGPGPAATAEK